MNHLVKLARRGLVALVLAGVSISPAAAQPAACILENGSVIPNPTYPYKMDNFNGANDLADLRAFAAANGIFANVNMSVDWHEREWPMIQAILSWTSRNLNYLGQDSDGTLQPRAMLMLNALSADGVAYGDRSATNNHQLEYPTPNVGLVQIAAGGNITLGLDATGRMYGWGNSLSGQLSGMPDAVQDGDPYHYHTWSTGWKAIAVSSGVNGHCLAIRGDGSIAGWGLDSVGQATPPVGNNFVFVTAAATYSLAIDSDGYIHTWGKPFDGVPPPTDANYVTAALGIRGFGLAINAQGNVVGWGENIEGVLSQIPVGQQFRQVAAGASHGVALNLYGSVYAWGSDISGESIWPDPNDGIVAIAVNGVRSAAIRHDGFSSSAMFWGAELNGGTWKSPVVAAEPGMGVIGLGLGQNHIMMLQAHEWICGSVADILVGLFVAHGIPGRLVGGYDGIGNADTMMEVFSTTFNKWILMFPPWGSWIESASGVPQSLAELRAARETGEFAMTRVFDRTFPLDVLAYRGEAANGSGLVFKPTNICKSPKFPFIPNPWWAGYPPEMINSNLYTWNQTWTDNRYNHDPYQGGAIVYHDPEIGETPVVPIGSPQYDYPLNNVEVTDVSIVGSSVVIDLIHNMDEPSDGFDLAGFEGSTNGGATWDPLSVEFGSLSWVPSGPAELWIRGVSVSGARSPTVVVAYRPGPPDGDMNGDGLIDGQDLDPFIAGVLALERNSSTFFHGDFDGDCVMDSGDISGMVQALVSAPP